MRSARLFVPSGTPDIRSLGLVLAPSHVKYDGIESPFPKAGLVRESDDDINIPPICEDGFLMLITYNPIMMTSAPIPTTAKAFLISRSIAPDYLIAPVIKRMPSTIKNAPKIRMTVYVRALGMYCAPMMAR